MPPSSNVNVSHIHYLATNSLSASVLLLLYTVCRRIACVRQIKGLDQELVKYRNALKKAKGPTATNIKKRAMETLKRKKMYEGQRDQMAGQQFNIEQTGFAIDSIKDTATTASFFFSFLVCL
ncbi:unnamed protein product [Ectocarpus sp. CCAP 1310/34]|nr:unnamed protein product [Ectocarpus sp. CCAP 1310/34]